MSVSARPVFTAILWLTTSWSYSCTSWVCCQVAAYLESFSIESAWSIKYDTLSVYVDQGHILKECSQITCEGRILLPLVCCSIQASWEGPSMRSDWFVLLRFTESCNQDLETLEPSRIITCWLQVLCSMLDECTIPQPSWPLPNMSACIIEYAKCLSLCLLSEQVLASRSREYPQSSHARFNSRIASPVGDWHIAYKVLGNCPAIRRCAWVKFIWVSTCICSCADAVFKHKHSCQISCMNAKISRVKI